MLLSNSEFVSSPTPVSKTSTRRSGPVQNFYSRRLKRPIDLFLTVVLVLITAPVLVPLMAISALLVSLDGHSPIYRQKRIILYPLMTLT